MTKDEKKVLENMINYYDDLSITAKGNFDEMYKINIAKRDLLIKLQMMN
jgi:hypothetical protein